MPICDNCGLNWSAPPEHCPKCGKMDSPDNRRKCSNCGEEIAESLDSCLKCGTKRWPSTVGNQEESAADISTNPPLQPTEVSSNTPINLLSDENTFITTELHPTEEFNTPINRTAMISKVEPVEVPSEQQRHIKQRQEIFAGSLPKWDLLPPMMPIKRVKRNL